MMCRRKLDRKPKYEDDVDGPIDSGDKASPAETTTSHCRAKNKQMPHIMCFTAFNLSTTVLRVTTRAIYCSEALLHFTADA